MMRGARWVLLAGTAGAAFVAGGGALPAGAQIAPIAPPSILKEDCSALKGRERKHCEARNAASDAQAAAQSKREADVDAGPTGVDADVPGEPAPPRPAKAAAKPNTSDMPTGQDADVPGEPAVPRAGGSTKPSAKPNTSDMPMGKDADPPASSMGPLKPDGTPDTEAPPRPGASSGSSSSSSSSSDDDDVAPTTAGGDSPVKAATLKDLGSHADSSEARVKLEQSRVQDDVKVGRFYLRDGNMAGAEARFKDALEHDPDDPEAHFAMAELLLKQKRNAEAAVELRTYLQVAPDDDHTKDAKKMLAKLGK